MKIRSLIILLFLLGLALTSTQCGDDDDSNSRSSSDDDDEWRPDDDADDDDAIDDDVDDDYNDDDDDDADDDDRLVIDPENAGYYDAAVITVDFPDPVSENDKAIDVYYPTSDGVTIDVEYGLRPTIIFAPDENLSKSLYASYGTHLASWGYLTIIRDNYRSGSENLAMLNGDILDWLSTEIGNEQSFFYHALDMNKYLAAGHGSGGKAAVLTAWMDERIRATMALDPNDDITAIFDPDPSVTPELMSFIDVPGQYFGAYNGADCVPDDENYAEYFDSAPAPVYEYAFLGAGHHAFVDNPECAACHCELGVADAERVKKLTRGFMVAFLNVRIRGWDEFDYYLSGLGVEQDVNMGWLLFRDK